MSLYRDYTKQSHMVYKQMVFPVVNVDDPLPLVQAEQRTLATRQKWRRVDVQYITYSSRHFIIICQH